MEHQCQLFRTCGQSLTFNALYVAVNRSCLILLDPTHLGTKQDECLVDIAVESAGTNSPWNWLWALWIDGNNRTVVRRAATEMYA